ncbi:MAG: CXXX repeat peptide modification system protein [Bacteroidales bacterium]|nr:MAG: CXXX repeat peptide modification system protein [Bacteroidales bacterium]
MKREKVGVVTKEEGEEILKLYERKLALKEILPSLNSGLLSDEQKNELYEKVLLDTGRTNSAFQLWWDKKSSKYNWKFVENGQWTIDFDTNEIFLVTN